MIHSEETAIRRNSKRAFLLCAASGPAMNSPRMWKNAPKVKPHNENFQIALDVGLAEVDRRRYTHLSDRKDRRESFDRSAGGDHVPGH